MAWLIEKDGRSEAVVRPVRWSGFSLAEIIKPFIFHMLLAGSFIAAYALILTKARETGLQTRLRVFGRVFTTFEHPGRGGIFANLALPTGMLILAFALPVWRAYRRRYIPTNDGLICRKQGQVVCLQPSELSPARFEQTQLGPRVRFGVGDVGILSFRISRTQARKLASALRTIGVAVDDKALQAAGKPADLGPTEAILWKGRQGLRAISPMRRIALAGAAVIFFGYGSLTVHAMATASDWVSVLVRLGMIALLGGTSVVAMVIHGWQPFTEMIFDCLGNLIVTPRRLVGTTPITLRIYREIPRNVVLDAFIVERIGRRVWISLRTAQVKGDNEIIDIFGVPCADDAVAATRNMCG
ncbi:MAG: hypothetical protein P0Y64_03345 [Candidatus Sphingomonas colombiensis]|nr:hypothetical protein [Sphingomonas sp.]WEK43878.1 MAG: hypothetical protein P0Y64_03345 [Sphingomonas sp.]